MASFLLKLQMSLTSTQYYIMAYGIDVITVNIQMSELCSYIFITLYHVLMVWLYRVEYNNIKMFYLSLYVHSLVYNASA